MTEIETSAHRKQKLMNALILINSIKAEVDDDELRRFDCLAVCKVVCVFAVREESSLTDMKAFENHEF
jgi:hypothetical protein